MKTQPVSYGRPLPTTLFLTGRGRMVVGVLLIVGLVAFELFNFDTTQYALANLMGDVSFAGLRWATVLATAFCAIDFAGLLRIFTPGDEGATPVEAWYLMGAWLLGATMNALMTWWAVSLTLINHDLGNEVLSRGQLVEAVPIFMAVLVWLTRILLIGSFAVAGEHIFDVQRQQPSRQPQRAPQPLRTAVLRRVEPAAVPDLPLSDELPAFMAAYDEAEPESDEDEAWPELEPEPAQPPRPTVTRIRRRPSTPIRRAPVPMHARSRRS